MNQAKIAEIFKSIQGEGKYAGVKQVFVRFLGCNIRCVWCDTPETIDEQSGHFELFGSDELLKEVVFLYQDCHSVSLTGGEPLLQADFLCEFLPYLKEKNLKTYLETNGILHEELKHIIDFVDIVAMDIKLPSSAQCGTFWDQHKEFLKVALKKETFIKTVISNTTTSEDVCYAAQLVSDADNRIQFFLQPDYSDSQGDLMEKCVQFQNSCLKYLNDVRIVPQIHKILKLR